MFDFINPWQWVSTEHEIWELPWLLEKCHQLCFALSRIGVSRKLEIVAKGIFLTGGKHILQSIERWGQQPVVITVTKNSMIFSKYSAYIGVTFNLKMDTQLLFFLCIITWFKSFRNYKLPY